MKYVSAAAPGSRWDIAVEYEIEEQEEEDDDDDSIAAEEEWRSHAGGEGDRVMQKERMIESFRRRGW